MKLTQPLTFANSEHGIRRDFTYPKGTEFHVVKKPSPEILACINRLQKDGGRWIVVQINEHCFACREKDVK